MRHFAEGATRDERNEDFSCWYLKCSSAGDLNMHVKNMFLRGLWISSISLLYLSLPLDLMIADSDRPEDRWFCLFAIATCTKSVLHNHKIEGHPAIFFWKVAETRFYYFKGGLTTFSQFQRVWRWPEFYCRSMRQRFLFLKFTTCLFVDESFGLLNFVVLPFANDVKNTKHLRTLISPWRARVVRSAVLEAHWPWKRSISSSLSGSKFLAIIFSIQEILLKRGPILTTSGSEYNSNAEKNGRRVWSIIIYLLWPIRSCKVEVQPNLSCTWCALPMPILPPKELFFLLVYVA